MRDHFSIIVNVGKKIFNDFKLTFSIKNEIIRFSFTNIHANINISHRNLDFFCLHLINTKNTSNKQQTEKTHQINNKQKKHIK